MSLSLARASGKLLSAPVATRRIGLAASRPAVQLSFRQQSTASPILRQLQLRPNLLSKNIQLVRRNYATQADLKRRRGESYYRFFMRQDPVLVPIAFFIIGCGFLAGFYTLYVYWTYTLGAFKAFPEPVAAELRKALYFTNYKLDPPRALKYFKRALIKTEETGMDPFSDAVVGVRYEVMMLMKKIDQYKKAAEVLEILKSDCEKWMERFGDQPDQAERRTRVLRIMIRCSMTLGDLYSDPRLRQRELAEERMVWGVEAMLKEERRRQAEGIKEGEGDWLSRDEIRGSLEELAHQWESKGIHYLSAPLFLQALTLSPPKSCHSVVLMNNLATALAQQLPPLNPEDPVPPRTAYVAQGRAWANKAIALASTITPPERDEECDQGCAVATHNLGEFAEMDGNIAEARKKYDEALALSKGLGFEEGVGAAKEGLKRLEAAEQAKTAIAAKALEQSQAAK